LSFYFENIKTGEKYREYGNLSTSLFGGKKKSYLQENVNPPDEEVYFKKLSNIIKSLRKKGAKKTFRNKKIVQTARFTAARSAFFVVIVGLPVGLLTYALVNE
jgi:hypothetical protein